MLDLLPSILSKARMRPLGLRAKCTLQIDYPSRISSRLIVQPAILALQRRNIHQSASTRQDDANRRHVDREESIESSSTSSKINSDSSSSPSAAKDFASGAAVPPSRELQPQLDEDPNSFPVFPEQSPQVSSNSVIGYAFSYTHKLLGWPCFEGIPCTIYSDRKTTPLWK